jgi:predicted AAA+ superfamily ATPase
MYIKRHIREAIEKASRFFPALLLTGARQVGKTTFLRRLAEPERKYVTFDDFQLRTLAQEDPRGFLEHFSPPVLLDEIQYVPELLNYIKIAIDGTDRLMIDKLNFKYEVNGADILAGIRNLI